MNQDKKKLGELIIWVVLLVCCLAITIVCVIRDFNSGTHLIDLPSPAMNSSLEDVEDATEEIQDLPSGVVEEPEE